MPSPLNRNIFTGVDAENFARARATSEVPRTAQTAPLGVVPTPVAGAGGWMSTPSQDDYLTKLLKYVPLEVLGAYLFLAGVIDSNVAEKHAHALWLGGLLIAILVVTVVYDARVLNVVRKAQIAMSVIGLATYIFAAGGWFATTTWYHQWYASLAFPVFGLLVAIVRLGPLPTTS